MNSEPKTASDVLKALDIITGGRVITEASQVSGEGNPFVITKSSNLPGKAVTETPGLVCGKADHPVSRLAVSMTLTESQIELAGALGLDAIVTHHPVADAASSGGVPLRGYLDLYGLAVFEVHEAFHGRHPGIGLIHGHRAFRVELAYAGLPGNIMLVGRTLPKIKSIGDILDRLTLFSDLESDTLLLKAECELKNSPELMETNVAARALLLNGSPTDKVETVVHIFPHTGFTPDHLRQVLEEHPEIDAVIASISRVRADHALVGAAREMNLPMIAGNSHALEILENGLPLALALEKLLPGVEVLIFKERVTAYPVQAIGNRAIRDYAEQMATEHLVPTD